MLHIINQGPRSGKLAACLRVAMQTDTIIFIENGVYALHHCDDAPLIDKIIDQGITCFVLQADIEARGLKQHIKTDINQISYADLVDLTLKHPVIQTW